MDNGNYSDKGEESQDNNVVSIKRLKSSLQYY